MGRTSDARERLMDAALDLIWRESYGAVTIDDICKKAEVKKGSFYYFFASKSELAIAALEQMWVRDWRPYLDSCFSPSLDPVSRITAYLDAVYPRAVERYQNGHKLGCPVCSVGSEVSQVEEEVNAKARELLTRKRRYYETAIRDGIASGQLEPGDVAQRTQAFACLLEGAVAQARIMNDPEVLKTITPAALELLRVKATAAAGLRS